MNIYYAMTKFHLLFCLTHRMLRGTDEEPILILYSGLSDVKIYQKKILEKRLFSEVLIIDEIQMRHNWIGVADLEDTANIDYDIQSIITELDNWLPFDISEANEIFLTNDHWALGIYCISKKIPYYFYEDGAGMLSKPNYSYELVYRQNKTQAHIAKYIGAFSNNENVIAKFADLTNQSEGFSDTKAVHYSVTDSLGELSQSALNDVLDIFGMEQIHIKGDNLAVLFTEHFINMKRLTVLQQYELYALIIDYFAKNTDLIIKPHPNDIHVNYTEIFPKARIISRNFPSELLPYCVDKSIDYGVAACSTAVLGLKKYFREIVRFDIDIENKYFKFHRYFALVQLLNVLGISYCDTYNVEEDIYNHFCRICNCFKNSSTEYKALILDEIEVDNDFPVQNLNAAAYDCIVFVSFFDNFDNYSRLIDTLGKDGLVFLEVEKNKTADSFLLYDVSEYILIKVNNCELKAKTEGVHIVNKLENVGAQININTISNNDKVKIKFLEACLDTANKKLKYYIEREKELLKQISEIEKQ